LKENIHETSVIQKLYNERIELGCRIVSLPIDIEHYIESLTGQYVDTPSYMKAIPSIVSHRSAKSIRTIELYDSLKKSFRNMNAHNNYKISFMKTLEKSNLGGLPYILQDIYSKFLTIILKREYYKYVYQPDYRLSYIYFSLNYQPERTTSPLSGEFVNQYLAIKMLSEVIPNDWIIYVKEHPKQFSFAKSMFAVASRHKLLYSDISNLNNVRLVSLSESSFELIDNSKIVASVNGTSSWEAVNRGKPTIIFGSAWYKGCEGVFSVANRKDCDHVVNKILAGYEINMNNLRLFYHSIDCACVKGYVTNHYANSFDGNIDNNIQNLLQLLVSTLREMRIIH